MKKDVPSLITSSMKGRLKMLTHVDSLLHALQFDYPDPPQLTDLGKLSKVYRVKE
ncbi:hypothetical protein C1646_759129 [Rhizophagus diaphanus]|nr:hypothetical protein C1646_759129 [Rhizophagus diaphanus] [Rhizophagus sp. MUCL 43196]